MSWSVANARNVQVRELSPADAVEALMSRLSYAASLRAEAANRCSAAKLSAAETSKLAATFAVLVRRFPFFIALWTSGSKKKVDFALNCLCCFLLLNWGFETGGPVLNAILRKYFSFI